MDGFEGSNSNASNQSDPPETERILRDTKVSTILLEFARPIIEMLKADSSAESLKWFLDLAGEVWNSTYPSTAPMFRLIKATGELSSGARLRARYNLSHVRAHRIVKSLTELRESKYRCLNYTFQSIEVRQSPSGGYDVSASAEYYELKKEVSGNVFHE